MRNVWRELSDGHQNRKQPMPVEMADPAERARELHHAKGKVRLRNKHTGEYLHMSGQGTTADVGLLWLGYQYQAEELRKRAASRGDDWPFEQVHRKVVDITKGGN